MAFIEKGQEIDIEAIRLRPSCLRKKEARDRGLRSHHLKIEDDRILLVMGLALPDLMKAVLRYASSLSRLAEKSCG